jgi:hypothetical protein
MSDAPKSQTVRMTFPAGNTFQEMRENIINSPMQKLGDAQLMWVNEGDIGNGIFSGNVEILANNKGE